MAVHAVCADEACVSAFAAIFVIGARVRAFAVAGDLRAYAVFRGGFGGASAGDAFRGFVT